MLDEFAVGLAGAGGSVAGQSTSVAASSGDSAPDVSSNQGREASVSTSPGQAALTRMSRRAASSASSRARTFTAAAWPAFDGGLIQAGHPCAAARPVFTAAA